MTSRPHDALFKAAFESPVHARGLLEAALPASIGAAIQWPTLARESGSFIDPTLADRHTDLLFSAELRAPAGAPAPARSGEQRALLYLLLEHQSTEVPDLLLRVFEYETRILRRHVRAILVEQGPSSEPLVMTIAEQFRQEGHQEGRQEGRVETLTKLLRLKFGELPPSCTERLAAASDTELDRYTERVLNANSLAEIFAS